MSPPRWFVETAHISSLVPTVLLLTWGRGLRVWWLVGLAFAVSYVADSVTGAIGGTWAIDQWWRFIQFALILVAVKPDILLLWALLLTAVASSLFGGGQPEWFLTLVGSCLVLIYARGRIAVPLWIYFGAGSVAYSWMLATMESGILPAWYTYQACRIAAFGAFVFLLHREANEPGSDRAIAGAARTARGG